MTKKEKSAGKSNTALGCVWRIISVIGYILAIFLIFSGLGLFGLSMGIIGAVLAYTNIAYREWLSKQQGYKFRLSKLPGMASSSPTVLAIATIGYSAPLSLLSWYFLLGSFSKPDTLVAVIIMGVVGIVLLFGWLIKGWGLKPTQQVKPENVVFDIESRSSAINLNDIIDYFKQYRLATILIPFALLTPLFCYVSGTVIGPIIITPTPTTTSVTPTLSPTPVAPTLTPTTAVIPSVTPSPIATTTPLSTTPVTPTLTSTATVIPSVIPSPIATTTPLSTTPATPSLTPTATVIPSVTPSPTVTITYTPEPTAMSTHTPTNSILPTSTLPAASTFKILVLTSPVPAGGIANVQVQTVAGASCFLSYRTPSGTESQASGLGSTTAGANGVCSWAWKISPNTKPGTGSLTIMANDVTEFFDIVIQ